MTTYKLVKAPTKNGICCPRCCNELIDTTGITLSDAIRKEVECIICDYASVYNIVTMKLAKNY